MISVSSTILQFDLSIRQLFAANKLSFRDIHLVKVYFLYFEVALLVISEFRTHYI